MLFPLFPESLQNYLFFFLILPLYLSPFIGIFVGLKMSITDKLWKNIIYILIFPAILILLIPFNAVYIIGVIVVYILGIAISAKPSFEH